MKPWMDAQRVSSGPSTRGFGRRAEALAQVAASSLRSRQLQRGSRLGEA